MTSGGVDPTSSEPSAQSWSPSHFHRPAMQRPLVQENSLSEHCRGTGEKTGQLMRLRGDTEGQTGQREEGAKEGEKEKTEKCKTTKNRTVYIKTERKTTHENQGREVVPHPILQEEDKNGTQDKLGPTRTRVGVEEEEEGGGWWS